MRRFAPGFCLAVSCFLSPQPVYAQIVPDNTLPVNSAVTPSCVICTIEGGTVRGVNLFHSFREFSIPTGGAGYFNNNIQIQSILTRVTGNSASSIDGLIKANGTANLFFINPNGILFGPNARLDIGGSFLATTANSFRFFDGSEFSATNPQAPPLLTMNVAPGLQVGTIQPGTSITNQGYLATGQDLTLVADKLDLQGQLQAGRDLTLRAQDTVQIQDSVTTPSITVAANTLVVQGDRKIDIFALNNPNSGLFAGGNLTLRSSNSVIGDAHFYSGSNFQIQQLDGALGNLISPHDPIIRSQGDVTFFGYQGTSLHILAGGQVTIDQIFITGADAVATTINPTATPALANITLSNGTPLTIDGNARPTLDIRAGMDPTAIGSPLGTNGFAGFFFDSSFSFALPPVNDPTVTSANITVGQIAMFAPNSTVFLTNQFQPNLTLPGGTIQVGDISAVSGAGNGGDVIIDARSDLNLVPGAAIQSQGAIGGTIRLLSKGTIPLSGNTILSVSVGNLGQGGDIQVTARQLSVAGSSLGSVTVGAAPSGNLVLNADTIDIRDGSFVTAQTQSTGNGGTVSVHTRQLTVQNNAQLLSLTNSTAANAGKGGDLVIEATESVQLNQSIVVAQTQGTGNAGNATINTPQLTLQNLAQINTASLSTSASAGKAGDLTINAESVQVIGGGSALNTISQGGGDAGNLTINATRLVELRGDVSNLPEALATSGGNIIIAFANQLASLGTESQGTGQAGNLVINTRQLIARNGGQISTSTFNGTNSNLVINATDSVKLNDSIVASGTAGVGNAGDIGITTGQLIANQSIISTSTVSPFENAGNGGSLVVNASQFVELNATSLATQTFNSGSAGNLTIKTPKLSLRNGAQVSSSTSSTGNGGSLLINAADFLEVTGSRTMVSSNTTGPGNAGQRLQIQTKRLSVLDGADINTGTGGSGNGGRLEIIASELVEVIGGADTNFSGVSSQTASTGNAGDLEIKTRQLNVLNGGFISASSLGDGNGGSLSIQATDSVQLSGAFTGLVTVSQGIGNAGNLTVLTDRFSVSNDAVASAATKDGVGGNLTVQANSFTANTGGRLVTSTSGKGNAGSINLLASEGVTLKDDFTGLFANTARNSSGNGGNIAVNSGTVSLSDRARIAVGSLGDGQGGKIQIQTNNLSLNNQAVLSAETASTQGGEIAIQARDLVLLRRNSLISATAGTAQSGGNGGNIFINSPFVVAVLSENSDIRANAFTGNGGRVEITAQGIFGLQFQPKDTPNSDITASSQFGSSGQVILKTPDIDPSRGLTQLPVTLEDPSTRIDQRCGSNSAKNQFTVAGRGGLPTSPTDAFTGNQPLVELAEPQVEWSSAQSDVSFKPDAGTLGQGIELASQTDQIVEAQNWVKASDGSVYLVTQAATATPHVGWQEFLKCSAVRSLTPTKP